MTTSRGNSQGILTQALGMNPDRVHTVKKNQEKTVFRDSQEFSGNYVETLRKTGKDKEFSSSMRMNFLVTNRQLYTLHTRAKTSKPAFVCVQVTDAVQH